MIAEALYRMLSPSNARSWDGNNPRDPEIAKMFGYGARTASGVSVDHETTLGYPAVLRGVSILANGVKKLPLNVYRVSEDGNQIDRTHPSWYCLRHKPHSDMTDARFKQLLQAWALLWGNGCAWINRDGAGRVIEMIPLLPDRTRMVRINANATETTLSGNGQLFYVTRVGEEWRKLRPENVFHIMGLSPNGYWGYDVVTLMKESIGLGMAAREHGSRFFGQGLTMSGVVTMPNSLDDEEAEENFKESVENAHSGLGKSHRLMILEEGAKFQATTMPHEAAQFLQTREFEIREVANIIGIQASKLGDRKEQSYNSLEMANQEHKDDDLKPWIETWEDEASDKLLTEEEKKSETHVIKFDDSELEWVPFRERVSGAVEMFNNGLANQDESRVAVNLPPARNNPNRKRFRMPSNIVHEDEDQTIQQEPKPDAVADTSFQESFHGLAVSNLEHILARLQKQATAKAADPGQFCRWLDDLATNQGPEQILQASQSMTEEFKQRLETVAQTATADELSETVAQCVEQFTSEGVSRFAELLFDKEIAA